MSAPASAAPWEPLPLFVREAIRTVAGAHPFLDFLRAYGGDRSRALVEFRRSSVAREAVRARRYARRTVAQARAVAAAKGWEWDAIVASVVGGA